MTYDCLLFSTYLLTVIVIEYIHNLATILDAHLHQLSQTPQRTEQCNTFYKSPPHVWNCSDTSLIKGNIISPQQCLLPVHTSIYHTVSPL